MKVFCVLTLFLLLLANCNSAPKNKDAAPSLTPNTTISNMPRINPSLAYTSTDISPMDVIYFPADYPVLKMSQEAAPLPVARIIYSRPHKQGRKIFGALIPYNEPWRLGANEATEIEFFQPVTIQNKKVIAGRYVLYCLPEQNQWTIIFNSNIYSWGLKQDGAKDVYRFTIPTQKSESAVEYFTMLFEPAKYGVSLTMSWDDVTARLPITIL